MSLSLTSNKTNKYEGNQEKIDFHKQILNRSQKMRNKSLKNNYNPMTIADINECKNSGRKY